jgi:hypothetical protein
MFREMHYMDRNMRAMDLAEKMAERRRQSLHVASRASRKTPMVRRLFAFAGAAGSQQAEGRA